MPKILHRFLRDQRCRRKLTIPAQRTILREENVSINEEIPALPSVHEIEYDFLPNENDTVESVSSEITLRSGQTLTHQTEQTEQTEQTKQTARNYVKLTETSKVADRLKLSNMAVAAVATAVLVDLDIVNPDNRQLVIDKNKVDRARKITRKIAIANQESNRTPLVALYFDGRSDLTKIYQGKKIITKREDHMSLVEHPGSLYLGHVTNVEKSATPVSEDIWNFIMEHSISTEDLVIVGCDGCVLNTGWKGGVITFLERKLGRPLQWMICLLHFNELPLRNLLRLHDGKSRGPVNYSGPIGKQLERCEKLPIVEFEPIAFDCDLTLSDVAEKLSSDQRYLFDICTAISNAECSSKLATRSPGKLSLARFTTLANRLCRLYVSTENPSQLLNEMVKYVLWVYAPTHFNIKYKSACFYGAIHLTNIVKASSFLRGSHLITVRDTIENNAFFAHPENVLLAVLNDEDETIRRAGWKRILEIHEHQNANAVVKIRSFKLDFEINYMAKNYTDLIDWENELATVPPILHKFNFDSKDASVYAVKRLCEHNLGFNLNDIPCHTQSVERCVKLVTEASMAVCGPEQRDGLILNTLQSRNNMPSFKTKSDYNLNVVEFSRVKI